MSTEHGEIDPAELRRLPLEGLVNFRDLGGYLAADGRRVRRRHLFRSDALHRLTEADAAQVRALGVTTLIDFRTTVEIEHTGRGGIDHLDAQHLHLPPFEATTRILEDEEVARALATAAGAYMMMLERGSRAYASALRVVAASEDPVVFFCAQGKDRTGVFAAVVLGLLGVADDDIVTDYALTHEVIDQILARRADLGVSQDTQANLVGKDLAGAYPASMQVTIERLRDRWGDWHGYARWAGLAADDVEALRARLLV